MGFFDQISSGISSAIDSTTSGVESLFGLNSTPFDATGGFNLNTGIPAVFDAGSVNSGFPTVSEMGVPMNTMAAGTALMHLGVRGLHRFPQLAMRLQSLQLTRAGAFSLLKKFGPASLISLGFAGLEISQLASSGSGRRRMNICNGRALRRASRRLSAFHNFYKRTCGTQIHHRRKKKC